MLITNNTTCEGKFISPLWISFYQFIENMAEHLRLQHEDDSYDVNATY